MALGTVNLFNSHGSLIGNFDTIQEAVNAAGSVGGSGKLITVDGFDADGNPLSSPYSEQVVVNAKTALTGSLTGLTIEGINGAVLQAPTTQPLVSTATSPTNGRDLDGVWTLIGTSGVTIEGLTVDGATQGANLAAGQNNPTEVGIAAIDANGTVLTRDTVENVIESAGGVGNQRGLAVYAANDVADIDDTFDIDHTIVSNFQKDGITVANAVATVTDDTITGVVGANAQNAIEITGSSGTVAHNTISNIGYSRNDGQYDGSGILELDGKNLSIDHNSITLNTVYTTGIFAENDATVQSNVSVTNNTIVGAGPTGGLDNPNYNAGIEYDDGIGGAITGNTISGFDVAIQDTASGPGTAAPVIASNKLGNGIGSAYFLGDGTTPTPASFMAGNTFTGSGPGIITVTGVNAPDAVYSSIQAAIDAATAGDTVNVGNGVYTGNVVLKNGVNLVGQSQSGVIINGVMSTPASFDDTTVSNLTVTNTGSGGPLLDMTATAEITDSVFADDTFELTQNFAGPQAIGNGQVSGSIALNGDGNDTDGIGGGAGLTFSDVTANAQGYASGSTAFAYTLFHSVDDAQMVLDGVTLEGADDGIGAQWNMSPNGTEISDVTIENSNTSGGGNFYVSGMSSATITNNTFNGQGLALNGVSNGVVTGNTFENIDGITANGVQHRGLVIENAFGATADSNISVTGNTFQDISAIDGAIALQRFMNGPSGTPNLATVAQLSDVTIESNTFTNVAEAIYTNPSYFGPGALLPSTFAGSQIVTGTTGNDSFDDTAAGDVAISGRLIPLTQVTLDVVVE